MDYHSEEDIPFPKIIFKNQPETFGCKIVGEIYQQTGPFQQVERDCNQDGDVYAQKIAGFQKMTDVNEHSHNYFYLSEHDFADLMLSDCIEYVTRLELKTNPVKNLIRAMVAYGLEYSWNDSDIIDALVNIGITYDDFCQAGAEEFVQSYFEDGVDQVPVWGVQPQKIEQAMTVLDQIMNQPNGNELFYIANILYMLQQDETPLDREEQLAMARRMLDVSNFSVVPLLTAERVDAVCTLLNNGITNRRSPEFPEATPEQMKKLLFMCDIDVFAEIIETVAVDNQKFYGPDNEYSEYAIEQREKAINAIQNVARFEDIDITDRKAVEQEVWSLLERAERKSQRKLNTDSPYYKGALELVESHCSIVFPDLYDILSNPLVDLIFKDGSKYDYALFYYNPDSNAGGQIVQCPFTEEQAKRMIQNEDYLDVLAENTQYLYDIDDICFFDCIFYLLDLKGPEHYLGNNIDMVCQKILSQNQESSKSSLSSKIAATEGNAVNNVTPENFIAMHGDTYSWSLRVWGGATGELWDHHKQDYIQKSELPKPLLTAHENLWEISGDDYLVEYQGRYYYMMDHIYNENAARSLGVDNWNDLYSIALQNAAHAARHEALKDALILVAEKSVALGAMHVVSVLVNAEESKEHVDKIRQVLSDCMFQMPEKSSIVPLDLQVQSASFRASEHRSADTRSENKNLPER